jgi:glycosyltransferase involved in cell wall biosynthesis
LDAFKNNSLKIRGDGVLINEVRDFIKTNHLESDIEIVPRLTKEELICLVKGARFLVVASEGFYETFGLVIIEAFACGIPVIVSRFGVTQEIVKDGYTGLHFTGGDERDLASKIEWLWLNHNDSGRMGRQARLEYEEKYTPEKNHSFLKNIYSQVVRKEGKNV